MLQGQLEPKKFFQSLNRNTMDLVEKFYDKDILFRDPIVELKNREEMTEYYKHMYENVETISWEFADEIRQGNSCSLVWKMRLTARNFNGNKPVYLDGVSVIKFGGPEGKAIYHRDYFDMGAFVYEGIPVLGGAIRFIKRKMHGGKGDAR